MTDTDKPDHHWRVGMIIGGKYALLSLRAEGGEGPLFEAQNTWIGRRVAVKLLHPRHRGSEQAIVRFLQQARTATQIEHPNIVDVLDMGQDASDGSFYIVQEFLHGGDLRALLDRHALNVEQALDVIVPIMGALVAVNERGIVHRDVKPENIFLARNAYGEVIPKLIDFGVARQLHGERKLHTRIDNTVGTIDYMSPEQARGDELDARADIWSVGVVLYESIARKRPFEGNDDIAVLARIMSIDPTPLHEVVKGCALDLSNVVHRALQRDPEKRWPSMRQFLAALLACESVPRDDLVLRHRHSLASVAPVPSSGPKSSPRSSPRPPPRRTPTDRALETKKASIVELDSKELETQEPAPTVHREELKTVPLEVVSKPAHSALEDLSTSAERMLATNALDDAIEDAEQAIRLAAGAAEVTGRMRLVQAVAHSWRGDHHDAARYALEAMELFPKGTAHWFAAAGEVAASSGLIGHADRLPTLATEILETEPKEDASGARLIAAFRLSTWLLRTGDRERADQALAKTAGSAEEIGSKEPLVRAWLWVLRAELAIHAGDPGASIGFWEAAISAFADSGDARNACVQRQNLASAYIQLGAFKEADHALVDVLTAATAMKLDIVAIAKANHAVVLAREGQVDAAAAKARDARDALAESNNRRAEAFCRIYLAGILSFQKDFVAAEDEARAAISAAATSPDARAYAFATLGALLLRQRRAEQALGVSERAIELLRQLGGVEEGESLIRLVYVVALRANHQLDAAEVALSEATARLIERANRISDLEWRQSFLENIAENTRTLARAAKGSKDSVI